MDLMHAAGIGPICKWADDHFFIHILCKHRIHYNQLHSRCKTSITHNRGQIQTGSRFWFMGDKMSIGTTKEFDDDNSNLIHDLSSASPCSFYESQFTYSLNDVNHFTCLLGTPWELLKDILFSATVPFIGFDWDLDTCTMALPLKKHSLQEVQALYGKLLHSSSVVVLG